MHTLMTALALVFSSRIIWVCTVSGAPIAEPVARSDVNTAGAMLRGASAATAGAVRASSAAGFAAGAGVVAGGRGVGGGARAGPGLRWARGGGGGGGGPP